MNKNKYDIIMPIGNDQEITILSINSALNQTHLYKNFIFIIDTKSDREANNIKNKLNHVERSIIIRTPRVGQGAARQAGIKAASSEFIAFLDSDDIWHPKKIELQLNQLRKEKADFSFCSYKAIDINNKLLLFNVHCKKKISLLDLLVSCPIGTSTVLCKTKIFHQNLIFSDSRKRCDYITWFKIWRDLKPKHSVFSEYAVLIIKHSNSISSSYWTSTSGYFSMQKAFKSLRFLTFFSYAYAFLYSLFQIIVKIKRKYFNKLLENSKLIKNSDIEHYFKN